MSAIDAAVGFSTGIAICQIAPNIQTPSTSAYDAVDGSSTGIQVPHCGCC
jgi:hypothetical protein